MSSGAEESVDAKKQAYFTKLIKLLDDFPKVFIVGVDNVGSNHMQKIRKALRGKGEVLMGKNVSLFFLIYSRRSMDWSILILPRVDQFAYLISIIVTVLVLDIHDLFPDSI